MIQATHNGTDNVLILKIAIGNPKDCKEITIVYSDWCTGVIGFDKGDEEVFNNFVITE